MSLTLELRESRSSEVAAAVDPAIVGRVLVVTASHPPHVVLTKQFFSPSRLSFYRSGHVSVPVYPTLTAETTKYILEHSESKLVFIGKLDDHPWQEMKNGIPSGVATISFPLCPKDSGAEKTWDDVIKSAGPIKKPIKRTRDEMATIIYTSGSTGK